MSSSGSLPTGTITFLFTDIEGSTTLWEHHADAMRSALVRHDTLIRSVITANNGHIFKPMGDAFCVAFADPVDALVATIDTQKSLYSVEWGEEIGLLRVRMALHTGVV